MVKSTTPKPVPFHEAFRFWIKLGWISFGGPTGQIAVMHSELVEKKQWISEPRFLHALNYCMLLPGPEAQQLAIYIGWLLHGTAGGIVAGSFFVIPAILILWMLSYIYVAFGQVFWISSVFYGLKGAVAAIVAAAVLRIGRRALRNEVMWLIAAGSFVAIYFFKAPFPFIILAAGAFGFAGGTLLPAKFSAAAEPEADADPIDAAEPARPSLARAIRVIAVSLAVWWLPLWLAGKVTGWDHAVFRQAVFFSKAAMVTFGGAYAVLPYVAQQAVEKYHWLQAGQMMDGLGLAETTPGPLIMVVQFVGFLGAWNQPGHLSKPWAAALGALVSTWATFTPSFLWIFLGAPYIERLRRIRPLISALSGVTAAVVGVVLNLGVWFAIHTLFPRAGTFDWFLVALSAACFAVLTRWKWDVIPVVFSSGLAGLLFKLIAGA